MAVTVETLEKLGRKITMTLPQDEVIKEVEVRLKRMSKKVKMPGFRPGKIPMSVLAQQYGASAEQDVLRDKLGQKFYELIVEADLKVAGAPTFRQITAEGDGAQEAYVFAAEFEVFPEVTLKDLSEAKVEKVNSKVDDAAIDRTLDILRKQQRTFGERKKDALAAKDDRATVDFDGKIDGEPFEGGKAEGYPFVIGEGHMLQEFEDAVVGMKVGDTKTFQLNFPEDYHGKDVAGKQADFLITLKKLEEQVLPEVDDEFAKKLGVGEGTVDALKADVRGNLEREVKARMLNRNKEAVMDTLVEFSELDLPKSMVDSERERLIENARAELKARGLADAHKAPIPEGIFDEQAERRVRLGLILSELVKSEKLEATPEQVKAHVEELASSYEKPEDVVRWYYAEPQRLAEVEALVLEENVTNHVLSKAKVSEKEVSFDELMER